MGCCGALHYGGGGSLVNQFSALKQGQAPVAAENNQAAVMAASQQAQLQQREAALQKARQDSYSHIMGHEMAHAAAAGQFGGGINIEYDANGIAVAGHVPVSIPGIDSANPSASIAAYQTIKFAALAPSDPSGADLGVAARADALMGQAQALLSQQQNNPQIQQQAGSRLNQIG